MGRFFLLFALLLPGLPAMAEEAGNRNASASSAVSAASPSCDPDGRCIVEAGYYRAYPPKGWDGRSPLPLVIHFHGYRESAADILARDDLRAFADRRGVLLVAPQGEGDTWSHPGSPARFRDEFRFMGAVMADLARRFPLDQRRILVSGFSQGAAMVWNLACEGAARGVPRATAYLAIAGTFWTPQPETCPDGAQVLLHIHGLADRTVPLEGRPIRNGAFRQGDVFRALGMMRAANGCDPGNARTERRGALACEVLTGCTSGRGLDLCLHPGGHDFDPGWLDLGWDFLGKKLPNLIHPN